MGTRGTNQPPKVLGSGGIGEGYHRRTNSLHETGPFAFSRTWSSLPSKPTKTRFRARCILKPGTPFMLKVILCSCKKDLSLVFGLYRCCGILRQLIGVNSGRGETATVSALQNTVGVISVVPGPNIIFPASEVPLVCEITHHYPNREHI